MTKVTILGEEPKEKKLEPIKVVACLQNGIDFKDSRFASTFGFSLKDKKEIKIIKTNAYNKFDCIAIDENGAVFLCHFNDGIV